MRERPRVKERGFECSVKLRSRDTRGQGGGLSRGGKLAGQEGKKRGLGHSHCAGASGGGGKKERK